MSFFTATTAIWSSEALKRCWLKSSRSLKRFSTLPAAAQLAGIVLLLCVCAASDLAAEGSSLEQLRKAAGSAPFPPLAPFPEAPQPPYLSPERFEAIRGAPFAGIAQTRADLERLALDMQLADWCLNVQISDAQLAPLLARAAALTGGEPTCEAVLKRLGWLKRAE